MCRGLECWTTFAGDGCYFCVDKLECAKERWSKQVDHIKKRFKEERACTYKDYYPMRLLNEKTADGTIVNCWV